MNVFSPPRQALLSSAARLLMRLVDGLAFAFHGWGKIQHSMNWMGPESTMPGFFQLLAAVAVFGGGIAWMLGLVTPLASFGLACTMVVAVWFHAFERGDPFVASGPGPAYEPAAVYLCVAVLLLLGGPGSFSADRLLFGKRE